MGRIGTALVAVDGTVLECDAIWAASVGAGARLGDVVAADDRDDLVAALAAVDDRLAVAVRTGRTDGALIAHLLVEGVHRDGVWYVIGVRTFQPADGGRPAARDPLTGLLDRAGLDLALAAALDATARGDSTAVMLLDLDGFKAVNDTRGHLEGDRLLRQVGAAIAESLREGDAAARFGGDEFAVVLRRASPREARVAADRILGAVARVRADASAGIVMLRPREPIAADEALSRADLALYAAKGSERGGLVEYPSGDTEAAVRLRTRLAWGQRLHRALEDDAFVLYADPIVDLGTGVVDGVELQLHLHDGDEYVPRDGYQGHALRAGLVERLDRWLIGRALAAAPSLGAATVTVAVASRTLAPDLEVGDGRLILAVADAEVDRAAATALAGRARFALDGFGSERGSPALLRDLPCSRLRLDADVAISSAPVDVALVRQAVALGADLGLDVAAPGLESAADAARLRSLGVRYGQGDLFGGAQPLDGLLERLAQPVA